MTSDGLKIEETLDDSGKPKLTVSSTKSRSHFIIEKSNDGFAFFMIKSSKGQTPFMLEGKFTSLEAALKKIKAYLNSYKESPSVRRDRVYKENH